MYLKRKVYDQLLDWKNDTVHSTLEVNGARQVGKTYIINKFADENFRHKIYITCLFVRQTIYGMLQKSHRLDSRYKTTGTAASRCF